MISEERRRMSIVNRIHRRMIFEGQRITDRRTVFGEHRSMPVVNRIHHKTVFEEHRRMPVVNRIHRMTISGGHRRTDRRIVYHNGKRLRIWGRDLLG